MSEQVMKKYKGNKESMFYLYSRSISTFSFIYKL